MCIKRWLMVAMLGVGFSVFAFGAERTDSVAFVLKHDNVSSAFVRNVMEGRPVSVSLYVAIPLEKMDIEESDMEEGQTRENYVMSYFEHFTRQRLLDWFENVKRFLETSARTKEFEDILPMLQRGVDLQFMHPGQNRLQWAREVEEVYGPGENFFTKYDWGSASSERDEEPVKLAQVYIVLAYEEDITAQCPASSDGCRISIPYTDSVIMIVPPLSKRVLRHEWGHAWGLEDLYKGAKTSPQTGKILESVMNHSSHLTCADADAIVYIMDEQAVREARQKYPADYKNHLSARILQGWKSFCPNGGWYRPLEITENKL